MPTEWQTHRSRTLALRDIGHSNATQSKKILGYIFENALNLEPPYGIEP